MQLAMTVNTDLGRARSRPVCKIVRSSGDPANDTTAPRKGTRHIQY